MNNKWNNDKRTIAVIWQFLIFTTFAVHRMTVGLLVYFFFTPPTSLSLTPLPPPFLMLRGWVEVPCCAVTVSRSAFCWSLNASLSIPCLCSASSTTPRVRHHYVITCLESGARRSLVWFWSTTIITCNGRKNKVSSAAGLSLGHRFSINTCSKYKKV